MTTPWPIRLAGEEDIPALEALIPLSVHGLQSGAYSEAQRHAALGPVFGVDRQLIRDGTYFVVLDGERIVGCGGWSRRRALYGGDRDRTGEDALIDSATEPARIRAFFVHPDYARRGIGRALLSACESAITAAGFTRAEMVATLPGEPLYAAAGYEVIERYEAPMPGGLTLPVIRMGRTLGDGLEISTDRNCLDRELIHRFLSTSYWAANIPRALVDKSIDHSMCFAAYLGGKQVAFARVITDHATFAYLADVFVLPEHRGRNISKRMMAAILAHPDLQGLRRWVLATHDAHGLYAQFGFQPLADPSKIMTIHHTDMYRTSKQD